MLSELVFNINFIISIIASIIGLFFCTTIILIVARNRTYRSATNLLVCNMAVLAAIYLINNVFSFIYGFRQDWTINSWICILQGYCYITSCTCLCYSCLIQATSRLFYTIFYKYKYLTTLRAHWYLIALNWIIGNLFSIRLLLAEEFILEKESRICTLSSEKLSSVLPTAFTVFIVPMTFILVIYIIIVRHVQKSTQRIAPMTTSSKNSQKLNVNREIKLVRHTFFLISIPAAGGTPTLIIVLWHGISSTVSLPESLFLLKFNSLTVSITVFVFVLLMLNEQLKKTAYNYLICNCQRVNSTTTTQH